MKSRYNSFTVVLTVTQTRIESSDIRLVNDNDPVQLAAAVTELQRLKVSVVAGANAGTKMDIAALRTEDTILAALAFYRDNQLALGPLPGQLSADEVSALRSRAPMVEALLSASEAVAAQAAALRRARRDTALADACAAAAATARLVWAPAALAGAGGPAARRGLHRWGDPDRQGKPPVAQQH